MPRFVDPFTGEVFEAVATTHYEDNDGVPHAAPVLAPRLTLRQRVERLLSGAQYPDTAWDYGDEDNLAFDDGEEPLTPAERSYLDAGAVLEARERDLQRPATPPPAEPKPSPQAPQPVEPGVASPPATPPIPPAAPAG
nr:MAG: hypothetical protein [Microvirus sp.]